MFRASSTHLQEVSDVKCTCMQPLVFSFSAGGRLVHLLRGDSNPAYFVEPKLCIKLVSIKEVWHFVNFLLYLCNFDEFYSILVLSNKIYLIVLHDFRLPPRSR